MFVFVRMSINKETIYAFLYVCAWIKFLYTIMLDYIFNHLSTRFTRIYSFQRRCFMLTSALTPESTQTELPMLWLTCFVAYTKCPAITRTSYIPIHGPLIAEYNQRSFLNSTQLLFYFSVCSLFFVFFPSCS